jgi:3-methyladenine DNA glycosylase AlkD
MINEIKKQLNCLANKKKANILQKFFKTGKGDYGEGDIFLGVSVPDQRKIAKKYFNISRKELAVLMKSNIHEERLTAVLILLEKQKKKEEVCCFYLNNFSGINNWDLVDISAWRIIGPFANKELLDDLYNSGNLWKKRVAMVSTFYLIRKGDYDLTLYLAEKIIKEDHDLLHKAGGWMLREVGKRSEEVLIKFLEKYYTKMPRVMLRYSIERIKDRERFLRK